MARFTLSPADAAYPDWARSLAAPPPLRVEGVLDDGVRVAIVGTRKPTREAEAFAFELSRALSAAGVVVWSGGAFGIDAAAHAGALAADRPTVAVLGSGLDHPSPDAHADLFDRVAKTGAVVSPFADGDRALRHRFLVRNSVLVAAVSVVVIVECGVPSGALNAASWARRLGRPVAAVPHAPWFPSGVGCAAELRRGATPVTCSDDVLELLGMSPRRPPRALRGRAQTELFDREAPAELVPEVASDPREARVLGLLAAPRSVADLCEALGEGAGGVAALLLDLTLRGAVEEAGAGLYVRALRFQA